MVRLPFAGILDYLFSFSIGSLFSATCSATEHKRVHMGSGDIDPTKVAGTVVAAVMRVNVLACRGSRAAE